MIKLTALTVAAVAAFAPIPAGAKTGQMGDTGGPAGPPATAMPAQPGMAAAQPGLHPAQGQFEGSTTAPTSLHTNHLRPFQRWLIEATAGPFGEFGSKGQPPCAEWLY